MKPHRGAIILVLGILGLVVCFPCGIAAWWMGNGDLREIDGGAMDPGGRGLTQAGRILGMIATILGVIAAVAVLAVGLISLVAGR
jgi:hypothetical protein